MTGILVAMATAPVLAILVVLYVKDKIEKEPIGLILLLLFLGMVSCVPAAIMENIGCGILERIFPQDTFIYIFIENFFIIALSEELVKYLAARLVTWKNKNFNFFYDGIIYAVTASLGFALLENILYVLDNGIGNAITRGILSVPGHACDGIIMGFFYAEARYHYNFGRKSEASVFKALALIVPILMHGFYDFALSAAGISSELWVLLFYLYVIVCDIICIILLIKCSKNDKFILPLRPEYAGGPGMMPANGMPGNGMQPNGMSPNGMGPNGMQPNGMAPNGMMQGYGYAPVPPNQYSPNQYVQNQYAPNQPQGKVPPMPPQNGQNVPPMQPNNTNNFPQNNGGRF